MALTSEQYKVMLRVQANLVYAGWHPAVAGKLVLRAAGKILEVNLSGMGILQTRRIRREDPGVPPRPRVDPAGRCQIIREIPGQEEQLYTRIREFENRGWNVMEVEPSRGFPRLKTYYACPPGHLPREAQPLVLQSQPWGGPLQF